MCRLIIVHLFHGVLLLAPTLVIAGPAGIGWATGCFAFCIVTAAILECLFTREPIAGTCVQDRLAIRIAGVVGVLLLVVFWIAQLEQLARRETQLVMCLIGALLLVLGVALRIVAIRALGAQFVSDIRIDSMIVRDRIYAYLRHPSEVGLLLIAVGAPLSIGSPLTASAAILVLAPISLWRMQRENKALQAWRIADRAAVGKV